MYEVRCTILIIDDLRFTIDDSLTCALTRGSCEAEGDPSRRSFSEAGSGVLKATRRFGYEAAVWLRSRFTGECIALLF